MAEKVLLFIIILLSLSMRAAPTPARATRYRAVDPCSADGSPSSATAINDFGSVTGYRSAGERTSVFLWDPRSGMSDLGTMGGLHARPCDIDNGDRIGGQVLINWCWTAFYWDCEAHTAIVSGTDSCVNAISDAQRVVGCYVDEQKRTHAFAWRPGSKREDLRTPGAWACWAHDVNAAGQIVGRYEPGKGRSCAFLAERNGTVRSLGVPGKETSARGINNAGQVVGELWDSSRRRLPFIWDPDRGMRTLPSVYAGDCIVCAINDSGQAVGMNRTAPGSSNWRAVIWDPDGHASDLNDLLQPVPGLVVEQASDINSRGWIAGTGRTDNGRKQALLLIPVGASRLPGLGDGWV